MKEAAIFAEQFVPHQLRLLNEAPSDKTMIAKPPPSLFLEDYHLPPRVPKYRPRPLFLQQYTPEDYIFEKFYAIEKRQQALQGREWRRNSKLEPMLQNKKYTFRYSEQNGHRLLTQLPILPKLDRTISGYSKTFRYWLEEERLHQLQLYEKFSQYNIQIHKSFKNHCEVVIEGIVDAKPPLQLGDICLMRPIFNRNLEVESVVLATTRSPRTGDKISITRCDTDWIYTNQRYNLRIIPSPRLHLACLSALLWVERMPYDVMSPLIFPSSAPRLHLGHPKLQDRNLSYDQQTFIRLVLARTQQPSTTAFRSPLILSGPAGTGKTRTLLSAIEAVLEDMTTRILICAPSHTAANVITQRLASKLNKYEMFRLLDATRPVETIPVNILPFCCQNKMGFFLLPEPRRLLGARVIVSTCEDASILYRVGMTNQALGERRWAWEQYVKEQSVGMNVSIDSSPPHFTHLFMDEAAQAFEPESLIALSVVVDPEPGVRKTEIALAGDPRQLSPQVYSNEAARAGLGRSWMERLLLLPTESLGGGRVDMLGPEMGNLEDFLRIALGGTEQEQLSVFLTSNFRCHEALLMVPSVLFYADRLTRAGYGDKENQQNLQWCSILRNIESLSDPVIRSKSEAKKQFSWPLHFRGVKGKDTTVTIKFGFSSDSWQNEEEAKVVVEIVLEMRAKGVESDKIGVMAPFRGQVVLIRQKLRQVGESGVNVGTIEDFQAVENHVIVLSLTRATPELAVKDTENRQGVFGQPKRSNVALTRAQSLLIVVGNPLVMIHDGVWRHFLQFCLRNGLYYGFGDADSISDENELIGQLEQRLR